MNKKVEIERMIMISNEFYKLTGIADKSPKEINAFELIPITANCTFSIELALKSLYYINNTDKATGHKIKDLYNLTKAYGLENFLLKDFSINEINKILDQLDNAFVEFRYLYGQNKTLTISRTFLKHFTSYINFYCNDYIKKNLK